MVRCDLPTPRTKTRPEGLQAYEATAIELSTPVHSRTLEGIVSPPTPWVAAVKSFTICLADSSEVRLRSILNVCTSGQSFLAKSKRSCARSVMTMGEAPAAAAHKSWQTPMGPAPVTSGRSKEREKDQRDTYSARALYRRTHSALGLRA